MERELEVETLRSRAQGEIKTQITRLGDELTQLVNLVAMAREALSNEMHSGMGYKRLSIADKDLRKLKDLTATFNSAVDCKVRFDKAQKQLAANMSPEEEMSAVVSYVVTLNVDDRARLLDRLRTRGVWTRAEI